MIRKSLQAALFLIGLAASPVFSAAQANHAIPRSFSRLTNAAGKRPMIDETTKGSAARKASHCCSKSGNRTSPTSAGTGGPHFARKSRIRFSDAGLRAGVDCGIQRFN